MLNQSHRGKRQFCLRHALRWASSMELIKGNRDKASYLRTFEDPTFISVRELPPHVAQVLEERMHRRSESLEEEEIPYQRMSGDR